MVDHSVALVEVALVVVDLKIDFVAFGARTAMARSHLNLPFAELYLAAADYYHSLRSDFDCVVVVVVELEAFAVASLRHLPVSVAT